MRLDPFYLIVGSADLLERLVPLGVRTVQLRAKGLAPEMLRSEAVRARDCCAAFGADLILNDAWELALDLGIGAVHLGQEDLETADLAALRRGGVHYGLSTHDEVELERALGLSPAYVALGPVYPTRLKAMKWGPQGLPRLAEWKARAGAVPLVAIGGLVPERLPGVFGAGADSAAVVTDIAQAADPEARTREWLVASEAWR